MRSGSSLKTLRLAAGLEMGLPWVMAMKVVPLTTNPTQELASWILTDYGHHTAEEGVYSVVEN